MPPPPLPTATTLDPVDPAPPAPSVADEDHSRLVVWLLNAGHAIDHMFLLIFATAVGAIAVEFGFNRWEDLMPFGVGAFVMFGVGSLPSGRIADSWGRRRMMLVFFFGIGIASLLAGLARNAWELAAVLTLLGTFASIYHPVGIPMLLQSTPRPGAVIGINGLAGNLGIAVAALSTGFLVQWLGWRAAFVVPGLLTIVCGIVFARVCPQELEAPAKRTRKAKVALPPKLLARVFAVMTAASITGTLLFNFSTNGNAQLLTERFRGIVDDPALIGTLLAIVYALASLAQVVVGRLIDRFPMRPLYLAVAASQIPLLMLATHAQGWWMLALVLAIMVFIFGAVPFTDAMIVRYVDDRIRSRVAGARLTVSIGFSSLAVWVLGPFVKASGFDSLLWTMAAIAACTVAVVWYLPDERTVNAPA
ncbi:MFS transporter [Piscinibacter sakaiensis]|uniref:MFS transporter n=1 Tax=Piscinibacter sakaiensis TaxID=1547922 RepID=UPI003AAE444A